MRTLFIVTPEVVESKAKSSATEPEEVVDEIITVTRQEGRATTDAGNKRTSAFTEGGVTVKRATGSDGVVRTVEAPSKRLEYPRVNGLQFKVLEVGGDASLYLVDDPNAQRVRYFDEQPGVRKVTFEQAQEFLNSVAVKRGAQPKNLEDSVLPFELNG